MATPSFGLCVPSDVGPSLRPEAPGAGEGAYQLPVGQPVPTLTGRQVRVISPPAALEIVKVSPLVAFAVTEYVAAPGTAALKYASVVDATIGIDDS